MLNRSVLVIRVREPFLAWLQGLPDPNPDPGLTLELMNEDPSAYLVPPWEDEEDRGEILLQCFAMLFEAQLEGWWTQEDDWPTERGFETFLEWFDPQWCSMVEDLVDDPLLDDA